MPVIPRTVSFCEVTYVVPCCEKQRGVADLILVTIIIHIHIHEHERIKLMCSHIFVIHHVSGTTMPNIL